jgi:hypothetical protein
LFFKKKNLKKRKKRKREREKDEKKGEELVTALEGNFQVSMKLDFFRAGEEGPKIYTGKKLWLMPYPSGTRRVLK